jgi:hypothetical protein
MRVRSDQAIHNVNPPSIKHSLTISHNCFMAYSGRYLQSFACSSHSSSPARGVSLAGPGFGTLEAILVGNLGLKLTLEGGDC